MKTGRNASCPCGSGRKYKHCHGSIFAGGERQPHFIERHEAAELVRMQQQGLGKPIISFKAKDHQIVAVGKRAFWGKSWKTFPDFLGHYIKTALGTDWGNAELKKPLAQRHPILQWYDAYCAYQKANIKTPGEVQNSAITGVVACYLGLAYGLYLLAHNVELQARLVARLKDPGNFQGAYYEIIIANVLLRAGFELALEEDESDRQAKHCEFAAISKHTGKKYWVEAKMRAVSGVLGRTNADGTTSRNPLSKLMTHLHGALAKPAGSDRLIFIDLNAPMEEVSAEPPEFMANAIRRLERFESLDINNGQTAYVFVTNMPFHLHLQGAPQMVVAPFGLGIPDFNREGQYRLMDLYALDKKHRDALEIGNGFERYLNFPATFDGSLPAAAFHKKSPIQIGNTYQFDGIGDPPLVGTVTTATVMEHEKAVYVGVTAVDGKAHILKEQMTDEELADYRAHPEAYFGVITQSSTKQIETPYEAFQWLMQTYTSTPKEKLLEWMRGWPDQQGLMEMSQEKLAELYCEGMAHSMIKRGKPDHGRR